MGAKTRQTSALPKTPRLIAKQVVHPLRMGAKIRQTSGLQKTPKRQVVYPLRKEQLEKPLKILLLRLPILILRRSASVGRGVGTAPQRRSASVVHGAGTERGSEAEAGIAGETASRIQINALVTINQHTSLISILKYN